MAVSTLERPPTIAEELLEKLYRTAGKAEIINGRIVEFMAAGYEPGRASMKITFSLMNYELKTKSGKALGDNVGFW